MTTALLAEPRWAQGAQALVEGCIDLPNAEERVALLAAVCQGLGDDLYPAFLRVLSIIGERGDHAARAAVADALVHALRTGRLPSGRRSAWGASASAHEPGPYGRMRSLGPLEYLCAWHTQSEPERALGSEHFLSAARTLMDLIATSPDARALYCEKLLADVDDPISGALTRQTRHALSVLASAWSAGVAPLDACARFLHALPESGTGSLATRIAQAPYMPR
jgi:hypothetical protein